MFAVLYCSAVSYCLLGFIWQDIAVAEEFLKSHDVILRGLKDTEVRGLRDVMTQAQNATLNYFALIVEGMVVRAMEAKVVAKRDLVLKAQDGRVRADGIPLGLIHPLLQAEMTRAVNKLSEK